jgi:microcin C transport system permease protein
LYAFRSNRRGFLSLCIFVLLCAIAMPAEFIANDKPIMVGYKGALYFPMFKAYPETTFGGYFETETNYQDPWVSRRLELHGWRLDPLIPYSYKSINYDIARAPAPPSSENWLGVDDQGRDVIARLIYGFRLSVLFALILTVCSTVIGIFVGALQGYFGGLTDLFTQRFIEIWSGLPVLYMLIILSSMVVPTFWWLLLLLLLFSWTDLVAVVRAEFLRARNFDYVRAARALGVPEFTIMLRRPAQRIGGRSHLLTVHSDRRCHHPHLVGFFGIRSTCWLSFTGRIVGTRQGQPHRPVVGYHRFCGTRHPSYLHDIHW